MADPVAIAVLYNQVGEEEYERMKKRVRKDPDFRPELRSSIATVDEEIATIVKALKAAGFQACAINIRDTFTELYSVLTKKRPDGIFNLVEFFNDDPRQEAMVAGMYDLLGIPYTGAPGFTLGLCQSKAATKHLLLGHGICTPRFKLMDAGTFSRRHGLRYPVIVKPAREDASAGIDNASVVENLEEMEERVMFIWSEYRQPALVEEFVDGRELHVPILGNYPPRVLPIAELDFSALPASARRILTYDAKWEPRDEAFQKVKPVCPARLSKEVRARVEETALQTYRALGCRDYARIDIRLDGNLEPYVLEVNPNPDLAANDVFMMSATEAGMKMTDVLRKIVEEALRRTPRARR